MAKKRKQQGSSLSPYLAQAQAQAALKFNPQLQGLAQLVRQAKRDYGDTIQAAQDSNTAQQAAIGAAVPQVAAAYDQARQQNAAVGDIVNADLAKIGPVSGQSAALQQALGLERSNAGHGLDALQAGITAGLAQQGSDTVRQSRAAITQAGTTKRRQIADIAQQVSDVAANQGDFIQATAGDLTAAQAAAQAKAAQAAQANANRLAIAKLGADTSAANAQLAADTSTTNTQAEIDARALAAQAKNRNAVRVARISAGAKEKGKATPKQAGVLKDDISKALTYARDFKTDQRSRAEAAKLLVQGRTSQTVKTTDPKTNVAGSVKIPGVPATDQLTASVALDLAYDGHVSKKNQRELRRRGFKVKGLGYPTYPLAGAFTGGGGDLLSQLIRSLSNG